MFDGRCLELPSVRMVQPNRLLRAAIWLPVVRRLGEVVVDVGQSPWRRGLAVIGLINALLEFVDARV